jgi:hypothetical protein
MGAPAGGRPAGIVASMTVARSTFRSPSTSSAGPTESCGETHMPSYNGANPSHSRRVRSTWRSARCASGTENAATVQRPSQGSDRVPKAMMRSRPSASTSLARRVRP